jgi:plastocyanin
LTVHSGDTVTWHNTTGAPHTFTVVNKAALPSSLPQVFACLSIAPMTGKPNLCLATLQAHKRFTLRPVLIINKGKTGLDTVGDSHVVLPQKDRTTPISAAAGSTLFYLCAIHPWMQGEIDVR